VLCIHLFISLLNCEHLHETKTTNKTGKSIYLLKRPSLRLSLLIEAPSLRLSLLIEAPSLRLSLLIEAHFCFNKQKGASISKLSRKEGRFNKQK